MNFIWKAKRYGLTILIFTLRVSLVCCDYNLESRNLRPESKFSVAENARTENSPATPSFLDEKFTECSDNVTVSCMQEKVLRYLENVFENDVYEIVDGVWIEKIPAKTENQDHISNSRSEDQRVVSVNVHKLFQNLEKLNDSLATGRMWFSAPEPPVEDASGKSSFLAGFGVGFLTFALKKLLLPFFLGAQIVKSVLIAMFLPSILGGLGKLVGKGVTTFASSSGSSGGGGNNGGGTSVEDFEFKDNFDMDHSTAESSYSGTYTYPEPAFAGISLQNSALPPGTLPASSLYMPSNSGSSSNKDHSSSASSKVSYVSPHNNHHYGSYYTKHATGLNPKQSYKVFHNIPTSSLLLTNYDPFYSPLLSRLDSVFKQLGYDTESCRERLVCSMYRNPAKFAPFSNLVSAQLSRELNELRKPSTDNPEILRFFRYMKAAKDGQDGLDCFRLHPGCIGAMVASTSPPMVKTFNDINKLVHARKLSR